MLYCNPLVPTLEDPGSFQRGEGESAGAGGSGASSSELNEEAMITAMWCGLQASPLSVVLCPTRELAIQIDEQVRHVAGVATTEMYS